MSRIILHVGHGKTGTSALQSSFALSVDALKQAGIHYPEHPHLADVTAGKITSGNIVAKSLLKTAKAALRATDGAVLFSNEGLFHDIVMDDKLLVNLMKLGTPVTAILYIRNPVEHATSVYGQLIKRGGYTGTLAEFLPNYRFLRGVNMFIANAKLAGVELQILNYSNYNENVLDSFAKAAGFSPSVLTPPKAARINRSLTQAEAYIQRRFNDVWGESSAQFISDLLCNRSPDIPSELPPLRREDYNKFIKQNMSLMKKENASLPPEEQYQLKPYIQATMLSGASKFLNWTNLRLMSWWIQSRRAFRMCRKTTRFVILSVVLKSGINSAVQTSRC